MRNLAASCGLSWLQYFSSCHVSQKLSIKIIDPQEILLLCVCESSVLVARMCDNCDDQ